METRKLYYEDCELRVFDGIVTECWPEGEAFCVVLDRTAFYPEGGGQAGDTGTLAEACVTDTFERDGKIIHLCDRPLETGRKVVGKLDWERRFDLMQQHTGEHMVSGVLHKYFGCHNVGFHMGAEAVTIDFDVLIPPERLPEIEAEVNRAVWEDLPVEAWYPEPAELENLFYRSKKALDWPVRIVRIPGIDSCACCGVHTARTGQVGLVKILSCIGFRGGVRIEMLCGRRALDYLNTSLEQNRLVSQAFSAQLSQTGEAARRMNQLTEEYKQKINGLWSRIFETMAQRCNGKGNVLLLEDGLSPVQARLLADRTAESCGGIAAVFSETKEGFAYALVSRNTELGDFCKEMNRILSGRGGGRGGFCQGSVKATRKQIESFFSEFHKPD